MILEDESKIRDMIMESGLWELALVSVLLLPIITGSWLSLLGISSDSPERTTVIIVIVVIYIISLAFAKYGQSKTKKQTSQKRILINRLLQRKNRKASYYSLEENSHGFLNDAVIQKLVTEYPTVFVKIRIKGKGNGVKLLEEDEE